MHLAHNTYLVSYLNQDQSNTRTSFFATKTKISRTDAQIFFLDVATRNSLRSNNEIIDGAYNEDTEPPSPTQLPAYLPLDPRPETDQPIIPTIIARISILVS